VLDDSGRELMAGVRDRLHPGRLSSSLAERYRSRDNAAFIYVSDVDRMLSCVL
jgi:hypothetical protein